MKEENFVDKKYAKKIAMYMILLISICLSILFFVKFLTNISVGAENPKVSIEANLEKYINFKISDEDKGTLVQYNVKSRIEQEGDGYTLVKESELSVDLNQIDGKYPYSVKVIGKSTEVTNGKIGNIQEDYQYDETTGTVTIKASNVNENGDVINNEVTNQNARDEYIIICYYDAYIEEAEERELDIKVALNADFFEENTVINQENEFKGKVKDNIGELSSISYDTVDISNGYIKSNIINGTSYNTTYTETQNITISKKETQEKIKLLENNTLIKTTQDQNGENISEELGNNGKLVYKSTKIKKDNMVKILGEDGVIEILDVNENVIATIDKNTEFGEDGTVAINYENEPEAIAIKTSAIQDEGILEIQNTKEIKSTMLEVNAKIKTTGKIIGINEEIVEKEKTETTEAEETAKTEEIVRNEIEIFENSYENIIETEDAQTSVSLEVSNTEWTNKQQNEITFDIYANSNTINDNMLKNPCIKIELPAQVEKVILGSSSVVYANELELQTPYLETNENGNTVIVANLLGAQTEYDENTLGLVTDVKISATIILKKDIEDAVGNVNLTFTNQYTLNGGAEVQTKNNEVQIKSYKEESTQVEGESITSYTSATNVGVTAEELKGLTLEVAPVKGDTVIADGDTVYEGEFIKYNIKVTNTTDKKIDDIKVIGTIPEGTTYGELEADYYTVWGKYEYNYDNTIKEKIIEIGSLEAGESINQFYEVKVNNLESEETEKILTSAIKTYVGETETSSYEISNTIKPAEIQVFLSADLNGIEKNGWNYFVEITSEKERTATLKVQLPKEFDVESVSTEDEEGISDINISEDNIITATVELVSKDSESANLIQIMGTMNNSKINNKTENSEIQLSAVALISTDNAEYTSNENRIIYGYDNISIVMTSDNEGEEVKYGDEINYEITIKNIGKSNLDGYATYIELKDYLPENVDPISLTYENWVEEMELKDEENDIYESTGIFNKNENEEDISVEHYDDNGDKLPEIDLNLIIPYGESLVIKIRTTAGLVYEKTKVENSITVSGDSIESKTSNIITHTILPYNYAEDEDIEDSTNPDQPNNPDNPINPDNPSDSSEKYSISGVAWIDENEDGKRQTSEQLLNGITVMIVDTNNSSVIKAKQVTDSNGAYSFSELDTGKYIIVFNYDTDTYSLTEYQKNGIATSMNSDATDKEINLLGTQTRVGLTDIISLDASIQNIDIGLIKNKICDLKLDKYISKVIVKTTSGTKEQTYDNTQLAKVEIKSKEIQGATVVVEYKFVITNEGELPTSVNKVIDYLPNGLEFSSELNKNWNIAKSGEITNTSISNQKIEPGKSMELELVLTKAMTQNTTGTFINIAEIGEISNSSGINDTDSKPGNKIETEDDYSKADLIISVSTGKIVIYISIFIILLTIVAIAVKFGILKITNVSVCIAILVVLTTLYSNNVIAANSSTNYLPDALWFKNPNMGSTFTEKSGKYNSAVCGLKYGSVTQNKYTKYTKIFEKITGDQKLTATKKITGSLSISKGSSEITKTLEGTDYILGPFKINSSNATKYEYSVVTTSGKIIEISEPYNKTNSSNGGFEFYLKIPMDSISEGDSICFVKLKATKTGVKTTYQHNLTIKGHYKPTTEHDDGVWGATETKSSYEGYKNISGWLVDYSNSRQKFYQSVVVTITKKVEQTDSSNGTDSKTITWKYEDKEGDLEIIKQDKDNPSVKLRGVQVRVQCDTENYDETFSTDENGKIYIQGLKAGVYTITEVSNPYYGYNIMAEGSVSLIPGIKNTYTLENEKQTGNLQIVKKDTNSKKTIEGISFKIKVNSYEKLRADINQDGVINITDVTCLEKYINSRGEYEGVAPHGLGDVNDDGVIDNKDKTLIQQHIVGITLADEEKYIIVSDSKKTYKGDTVTGTISLTNMETTANADEATTFITDENGKINILNMLADEYFLEETSVGDNYGYEVDGNYISYEYTNNSEETNGRGNNIPFIVTRQTFTDTEISSNSETMEYSNVLNVYNKKKYIKLSGYAWEDMYYGKRSNRNNLYNNGNWTDENGNTVVDNDKRLENITVTLYSIDGTILKDENNKSITTKTDGEGNYILGNYTQGQSKIKIEDLEDGAYIQFSYNGLPYQTVDINCIDEDGKKVDNGNTAGEFKIEGNDGTYVDLRDEYNKRFGTITHNATSSFPLNYDYANYASTLNYSSSGIELKYGYEGAKYPISSTRGEFYISARTETNINPENKEDYRLLGQNKTIDEILSDPNYSDEITNINLGLCEREQPDLAIAQDVYNVDLQINGYTHTYEYANRFSDEYQDDIFNVGVKFGTKYGEESYTRTVYESDCKYTGDDKLKAYVTYKIAINNQATELKSRVNSIIEYYDKTYYKISGAYLENDGNNIALDYETVDYNDNNYEKVKINTYNTNKNIDLTIDSGKQKYVYVKFEITDIGAIFFDGETKLTEEIVLNTYAEINSYSTISGDGKIYAGIDKDSNPGNVEEEKKEDDTDWAPSLVIVADKARTISGTVFLDESVFEEGDSDDTHTGKARNGNGIYEDSEEETISGVKVSLYKADTTCFTVGSDGIKAITGNSSGETRYLDKDGNVLENATSTDSSGRYEITDFVPGDYVVVYTWGDNTYIAGDTNSPINVNDYKGTIYNEKARATYKDWYRGISEELNRTEQWRDNRYSDAMDDYALRQKIDNNSNISRINSMTPTMRFGIEYKDDIESYIGTSKLNDEQNNKLTFNITNVDFGITERARQELDVGKKVKSIKITLTNGQTLVSGEVTEENGTLKLNYDQNIVSGMASSDTAYPRNGYLKVEIDNELLQGSTLEIQYVISLTNNSELDYDTSEYYLYGEKGTDDEIIKYLPTEIYDYLDSSMTLAESEDENWDIYEINQYSTYEEKIKETITEEYLHKYYLSLTDSEENVIEYTGYESFVEQYKVEEWNETTIKEARKKRLADKTILHFKSQIPDLLPGTTTELATLNASKVLANTDEINLNNDVEITEVTRTSNTGRKVTPSSVYDKSETVTVTTNTGDNKDYIPIISTVISLFIILGTGIVFIKKKILR